MTDENATTQSGVATGETPAAAHLSATAAAAIESAGDQTASEATPPAPPLNNVIPGRSGLEQIYAKRRRQNAQESGTEISDGGEEAERRRAALRERGERATNFDDAVESRRVRVAAELADDEGGVDADTFPDGQPDMGDPPNAAPHAAAAAPSRPSAAEPPPGHRAVVVNGQVVFVPESELDKLVGMGLSAQQRFAEAARMRDEAIRIAAQHEPPPPPVSPGPPLDDFDAEKFVDAVQYGSREEAVEAVNRLAQVAKGADKIQSAVAQQVLDQLAFQSDLARFGEEFSDVVNDGDLAHLAAQRVNEIRVQHLAALGYDPAKLRAAGPEAIFNTFRQEQRAGRVQPDLAIFRAAGNAVRAKFGLSPNGGARGAPPTRAERLQMTRAAGNAPRPASARFSMPEAPPPRAEGDYRSVVNEMRKARGQPVYDGSKEDQARVLRRAPPPDRL